jgi:phytanoyl-CoA hydroxylase
MDFLEKGFQFFPQLLGRDTVAAAREEVERLCERARRGDLDGAYPLSGLKAHRNPGISTEDLGTEPFLLPALPAVSEVFTGILLQQNLWDAATEVLQTKDVVYHFSNITRKPARIGPNMTWHRDYPNQYICPKNAEHFFRLLIPLEEMDLENGCTLAVPQTHLVTDELAAQEEKRKDFPIEDAEELTGKAGDAFAIHSKVVHGGTENRSNRERNLMVVQLGVKTDDHLYWAEERFTGFYRNEILSSYS